MKKKILYSIFLVVSVFVGKLGLAQDGIKQIREVSIITDSSKVIADIWMKEYKAKKLYNNVTYAWYYRQQIHYTQGDYSGRVLHGKYKRFDKRGKLRVKGCYHQGLKTGAWKFWDANGVLIQSIDYEEGLKHGLMHVYDADGKLLEVRNYNENLLHKSTLKYDNGTLLSETKYRNGRLIKVTYYKDGKRVKERKKVKRKQKQDLGQDKPNDKVSFVSKVKAWFKKLFSKSKDKNIEPNEDSSL